MLWIMLVSGLLAALETVQVSAAKLADIYWNSSNPMFRIDNTDHIIDVNKGNIPYEYDQVNIICPVYAPDSRDEDVERYIIYNVSKEEYDSCRITNPRPRIIARCDMPHQLRYFTITFRSFTPQPGGLEFRPGQDYYFISTSGGGNHALGLRDGGRCASHNMKVIFKVCCSPSTTTPPSMSSSSTSPSTEASSATRPGAFAPTIIYRYRWPTTPPFRLQPPKAPFDFAREGRGGKGASKKSEDRDKLPNETRAKNEELVKSLGLHHTSATLTLLLLLAVHHLFARCTRPSSVSRRATHL